MAQRRRLDYTPLKLADPDEAAEIIRTSLAGLSLGREWVSVENSLGRIASSDVFAGHDIPARDISAMDGIAVRWSDISSATSSNPVRLRLMSSEFLEAGCASRIYTGTAIPESADTVVKVEQVEFTEGGEAIVSRPVERGKNVVRKGSDIPRGSKVISRGQRITARDVVLLMELDVKTVEVYNIPRLGIVCVGDELFYNFRERGLAGASYAFLAANQFERMGCNVTTIEVVPDDEALLGGIVNKLVRDVDAVLTIGGSSVGGNDIVKRTVVGLEGAKLYFSGVQHNPFKSAGYAVAGKPTLMLPGHAVSMTAAIHFLGSVLAAYLTGMKSHMHIHTQARLSDDVRPKNNIRTSYLVKLERSGNEVLANPMPWGTNSLSNLTRADGFVTVDKGSEIPEGTTVLVSLLQ
ncbi:MAG: molybdopterin molybdotransferase MoeA [Nitrososphaerota archaeon]